MTGVSLELITDIDKYLMVEKGLRVGGWGGVGGGVECKLTDIQSPIIST